MSHSGNRYGMGFLGDPYPQAEIRWDIIGHAILINWSLSHLQIAFCNMVPETKWKYHMMRGNNSSSWEKQNYKAEDFVTITCAREHKDLEDGSCSE